MDAQLRVRSQMEELRHCLKDLNEWSQDMNTVSPTAEENELGRTGTSTVPIRGKVDLQFTEKQKEERKKSNSTSHGSATDSKAKHTYDNYRDKWDNFDVERALAEVDDQKVANNISTEKGELKEIEHNDSEHVPMLHPSLAQSGVTADSLATNMKISRRPEPKRMDGNEVSVSLRSEGNNAYSKGDYQRALDLYQAAADAVSSSSSINDEINENLKSAYSNMAMAYLKVHDWQKAESTSTRALEIDTNLVKARQRRALARTKIADTIVNSTNETGNRMNVDIQYAAAIADLEHVASIEPASRVVRDDLSNIRLKRMNALEGGKFSDVQYKWHKINVEYDVTDPQENGHDSSENINDIDIDGSMTVDENTERSASKSSSNDLYFTTASQTSTLIQACNTPPKSALEFESRWRAFGSDDMAKRSLLTSILSIDESGVMSGTRSIPSLFKSSVSGEMLFQILGTLLTLLSDENVSETCKILEGISCIERFSMGMMLLGKKKILQLKEMWEHSISIMKDPPDLCGSEWKQLANKFSFMSSSG